MGKGTVSVMVTYVLLAVCVLVCKTSAAEVSEIESDTRNDRDRNILHGLELFIESKMFHLLQEIPSLVKYVALSDPEHTEIQNSKFKRNGFGRGLAGLENLDFMTGIFSKLPMKTNAALSDMQQLMRAAGRRRK